MYDPMSSSLTRQAWAYQQKLIDEMGEGLEGLGQERGRDLDVMAAQAGDVVSARLGLDREYVATCGAGFLAAGVAGYAAGKVGVVPTAIGVGIAYMILKGM